MYFYNFYIDIKRLVACVELCRYITFKNFYQTNNFTSGNQRYQ